MENASKALIIAGAILLSILIIGLGMFIYNQAAGVIGDTGLDSEAVRAHNNRFLQYEGTQTGSMVRQLISTVTSYNTTQAKDSSELVSMVYGSEATTDLAADDAVASTINADINTNVKAKIRNGQRYTVSFGEAQSGLIVCIAINPVTT